ncbi:hypothetical protein [Streptomyces sp. NPDC051219]|uniref:hypothetical protein n=1 Tax=Streptomyces sp. NPDC051219 TaxID=3155283 RepID=UPI00343AB458
MSDTSQQKSTTSSVCEEPSTRERDVTVAGDSTQAVGEGVAEFLARRTPGAPYTAGEIAPMLSGAADRGSAERIAEVLNIFRTMVPPPAEDA